MLQADIRLEGPDVATVSPLLFGGLVEHLGRTIYGGIWDPATNTARADVQAAIRALGVPMLRWPGGCFSSWYHWRDGVGDLADRPRYDRTVWTDMAAMMGPDVAAQMGPEEPNLFGTDEFLRYCVDLPCEPLLVANIGGGSPPGEGTPAEAADWVRHCNLDADSPLRVQWWAVGNETWGGHELGHCSATEYALRFNEFSTAMRAVDPTIKLVAAGVCPDQYGLGSSGIWDGWNSTVLADAGAAIDALSFHWYFPGMIGRHLRDDESDYLQVATGADDLDRILRAVTAELDDAEGGSRVQVALDEWGQMAAFEDHLGVSHRLSDAVFFAGCFNAMIRHADRLSMAMIAGLVNVLAPIQTVGDRHFVTSAYLVALLYRQTCRRGAVRVTVEGPELRIPAMGDLDAALMMSTMARKERTSPAVDAAVTTDTTGTTVFVSNRSIDEPALVRIHGVGADGARWRMLSGPHLFARNDVDHPDTLRFTERAIVDAQSLELEVPPASTGALMTRSVPAITRSTTA